MTFMTLTTIDTPMPRIRLWPGIFALWRRVWTRHLGRASLGRLSERDLRDIGLMSGDLDQQILPRLPGEAIDLAEVRRMRAGNW